MNRDELILARIHWEGPEDLESVIESRNEKRDYGLYQVYGEHPVFGLDSLLYIGVCVEQSFSRRFQQHRDAWLNRERSIKLYLGRLSKEDYGGGTSWEKLVREVEALTIYWHSPPCNSQHINRYGGRSLCVQNLGNRARLDLEYTSFWDLHRDVE
jgi:hypothetical protein